MTWQRHGGRKDGSSRQNGRSPVAERITAWIGLVLVLGVVGYLLYEGLGAGTAPPDIELRRGLIYPRPQDYLVEVRAHNRGDETAAQVKIIATLKQGETVVEEAEFTLDYVPPHSERGGGLFFRHDPRRFTLELAATGYAQP